MVADVAQRLRQDDAAAVDLLAHLAGELVSDVARGDRAEQTTLAADAGIEGECLPVDTIGETLQRGLFLGDAPIDRGLTLGGLFQLARRCRYGQLFRNQVGARLGVLHGVDAAIRADVLDILGERITFIIAI